VTLEDTLNVTMLVVAPVLMKKHPIVSYDSGCVLDVKKSLLYLLHMLLFLIFSALPFEQQLSREAKLCPTYSAF
jgi:hypothetical protein